MSDVSYAFIPHPIVGLEITVRELRFYKKYGFSNLLKSEELKKVLISKITSNSIILEYIKDLTNRTDNYSQSKKYEITSKAFPLCVLFSKSGYDIPVAFCGDFFDKERNDNDEIFNTFFWNFECLDATLRVLRIILKEYKEKHPEKYISN